MTISPTSAKSALRQEFLTRRRAVASGDAEEAAQRMAAHFLAEPRFAHATPAALYLPVRGEIDPIPLLSALAEKGVETALPVVSQPSGVLSFRAWRPGDLLIKGLHNIETPLNETTLTPALILVPLLAFDARGHRLGYGGGYYDRTLAALRQSATPPLAVGIAYACQEAPSLPTESFDERLDAVVTERGIQFFE